MGDPKHAARAPDPDTPINIRGPEVKAVCNQLGWPGLRMIQRQVVKPILEGRDVVAVLPTSAGKSGIFQVPALLRPGLTVVVSPLVALMADQVARLREHGVAAHLLNSHCSARQKREVMDQIQAGQVKLLYLSPERLQGITPAFFGKSKLQMFAIDEAHCISEWGHDFRPAYMKVGRSLARLGDFQRVALTATATAPVVDEIASVLGIDFSRGAARIVKSPDRPGVTYGVAGKKVDLVRLVQIAGTPCLVYGSTRKSVEEAAIRMQRAGFTSAHYHAGMNRKDRMEVQDKFRAGDYEVIVATCAFGMGIDNPGIRSVVHLEMPTSLEAYMQESGRAGRDGSASIAICRATVDTLDIARNMVSLTWPTPRTVWRFWDRIQPLFEHAPGKWEGSGRFQRTNREVAVYTYFDEMEVGSCLRILADAGALRRISYQDRPVTVSLLSGASLLRGIRQREVIANLRSHADHKGTVVGSVAFFKNSIGLNKRMASQLNARHAIQFEWVDRCQLIERLSTGRPDLDKDQLLRIRRRSLMRIKEARGFLETPVCRRAHLLRYFGDTSGGRASGRCCDLCVARSK